MHLGWRIVIRLAICVVVSYAAFRFGGLVAMMPSLVLLGVLMARPLLDLASEVRHAIPRQAWKPVQGRYWAFHGTPVQVFEDEDHRRWILASDVRASSASPRRTVRWR
jgi:hypothetical protein